MREFARRLPLTLVSEPCCVYKHEALVVVLSHHNYFVLAWRHHVHLRASSAVGQGIISPDNYTLAGDYVHQQWYNLTYFDRLQKRQEQRLNFRVYANAIAIAGYTYSYGAEQWGDTVDACEEYHNGQRTTAGLCVKNSMRLAAGYGIVGALGYAGDTACVALLQGVLGVANTLNGNQGQGPNARSVFDPPDFEYGTNHTSDDVIDLMNNAIDVNRFQRLGGNSTESLQKRSCIVRNGDLYTKNHYFVYNGNYGMKLQCKNGCGDENYNSKDMGDVIDAMIGHVYSTKDLNAQFTTYDRNSGKVYARCKFTFEDAPTDSCPELITGSGCKF